MKPEPICRTCKHFTEHGVTCGRVKDVVYGQPVSAFMERTEHLTPGMVPRLPLGEHRCGPNGLHWDAREE